ncbi:hypothetical protein SAMN04487911_10548 [Arenibacter nanhaiticus]|uniref:Uncharacterized protein n=1 Tax=Arenibacter nanhaiticus TaxID=558155 RepID=A0A1M6DKK3_9FLAO|nr:hypothetical protein SAMN04487911_10548 [Arenibacter nanhaiticus]
MEKIYSENQSKCKLTKANSETIAFLMSYSKSLQIVECNNMQFESNLN